MSSLTDDILTDIVSMAAEIAVDPKKLRVALVLSFLTASATLAATFYAGQLSVEFFPPCFNTNMELLDRYQRAEIRNLSLHPHWHVAMPAYQHSVGVVTHAISALAFYMIAKKTPKAGRHFARYLMLLQASITLVDFNFGFLTTPIGLYPLPGALCYGVLCTVFGASGHVGISIMFFTVSLVAVAIIFCFHYKFLSILEMTSNRTVSVLKSAIFRVTICAIYSIPWFIHMGCYRNIAGGCEFTRINFPSLYYLFENPNYHTFVYDPTLFPGYSILLAATTVFIMVLATVLVVCCVAGSFYLLSQPSSKMSCKRRQLQRKIMLMLIISISVPLIIQLVPMMIYAYSLVAVTLTPDINNFALCFQMTHAFAHTSILILTTPSYREALLFWRPVQKKSTVLSLSSQFTHLTSTI